MRNLVASLALALLGAALVMSDAQAARLGGGRSMGTQRSIANPPPASPPARQAQQAAPAQQPATAPSSQAAPSAASRWLPVLGGLALGGILGSLFGGGALGGVLLGLAMIALLVFGATLVARTLAQRRAEEAAAPYATGGPYAAALGNETVAAPPPSQASGFETPLRAQEFPGVPAGFDVAGFLRVAKLNFMRLQAANDSGDLDELREFTTPDLYEELRRDALGRPGDSQHTDVVSLNADLLEVVTEGGRHWASVRFSGTVRETPAAVPDNFEEIWNLAKPTDGSSGWVLAGIQQMH